jgi:hypothetical protein
MSQDQEIQREILPIPDRPYTGLVPYDAKDPDTSFPPIEPLRPPAGAPNVFDADHLISPEERLQIAMAWQ